MGRPTKENSLSRQDVINAAIRCIDEDGLSALGVSRVARSLGIKPPALYKHLDSAAHLQRATVLEIWQRYLTDCEQALAHNEITPALLKQLGFFTRNFAKAYPGRYQLMMQVQLQPRDPEAVTVIHRSLSFLRQALAAHNLTDPQLIDVMRMLNAAIYGFISLEQSGLMTLERPVDQSYGVMLEALMAAVRYVQEQES